MSDQLGRIIDVTRAVLGERATPDFRAAVMRRIEGLEPAPAPKPIGIVERLSGLLWSPREVVVRPAYALAGAAAVLVLLVAPYLRQMPPAATQLASGAAADPRVFVQFRLEAGAAMRVQLAGSFTNWEPRYELHESTPGVWTITVPLTQGVHDYAFVVDGQQWVPDPHAPQIGDGFGGTNSRLALLSPDTPQS
jgi:hypothetical protein